MSGTADHAWYIYAIRADDRPIEAVDGLLPGVSIEMIAVGRVFVLASLVLRALFDRDDPANRCAEPDWMAERAAAHHHVNVAAMAAGPSLPLSFGTMFTSLARLAEWVRPREASLVAAFDRVAGREEWLLTVEEAPDRHLAWLQAHDPDLVMLQAKAAASGEGLGFLLARRIEKAGVVAREAHLRATCEEVETTLQALAESVLPESRHDGLPAWSILAAQADAPGPRIVHGLDRLHQSLAPRGLGVRLTGPWPAYAFARALCEQEMADV